MINYILKNENAVYHECGFSCDNELFLKLGSEAYFITDPRYTTEAKEQVQGAEVIEAKRDLSSEAKKLLRSSKIQKLYYDPSDFSVAEFNKLKQSLKLTFKSAPNFSQKKRIIKSEAEIELIKTAVTLGSKAFDDFAAYLKKKGFNQSEQYINFEAMRAMQQHGKYDLSFHPITAVNANAAKPHAYASELPLITGDLLLVDAGLKYERFCSDRTRTAEFGEALNFSKTQTFSDKTKQKVYDTVLKAQEASIKAIKPGVRANEIDRVGREIIDKAGFGSYFIHSTGHGVGLDIHELPVISQKSSTLIEENMIFTVEPGIYLPNEFGVRIEDMVQVTQMGAEIL
ncbi:MAG: M24 family metallopeptidase [Epsilonproteobacteria bacterium]|nr:M24 family metallopeptidase [Campylobacterota bacterium]